MKKLIRRVTSMILVASLIAGLGTMNAFAATYNATIQQGNTPDVMDCVEIFDGLKSVPSGNTYIIDNFGWQRNVSTNSPIHLAQCATPSEFASSGKYDFMYWSGHGGSGPLRLNVNASRTYGSYTTFDVANTLNVNNSNWASTSAWNKSSPLKVAIIAACYSLDNTYNDCKYWARAMRASNLRVVAGYHISSPTDPYDTKIAHAFFSNSINGGVKGGESVRSSWQTANEMYSQNAAWAVMCYKENGNQYYRIPGFPGKTYSAPSSNATIYRFWNQYKDPESSGQIITPNSVATNPLPLELKATTGLHIANPAGITAASLENDSQLISVRELEDSPITDESAQKALAEEFLHNNISLSAQKSIDSAIKTVGTITCEEIDEEIGLVEGSQVEVGKTYCYNNQYNGVKVFNNFLKIGTDSSGIYFIINKWSDMAPTGTQTTQNVQSRPYAKLASDVDDETALIYVPVGNNTYRLAYEVLNEDDQPTYYDWETLDEIEIIL